MDNELVKIRLKSTDENDYETVWAEPLADNYYRLDNSPFFAYGLSWRDVVEARVGSDGVLDYVRVIRKSGNRTVRIIFPAYGSSDDKARVVLEEIRKLGCSYEGMKPSLVSVNVPPDINLASVTNFLKTCSGIEWEYADPTYSEITGTHANS